MAIAWDAGSTATPGTGQLSWTHTPVGVPKGIVIMVLSVDNGTDGVTTVTYGGVSCTEVSASPALLDFAEKGGAHVFHLGANIPVGAQTAVVNVSGAVTRHAVCWSYTASADRTEIVDSEKFESVSFENPSVTLTHNSRDCCDGIAGVYGGPTASVAPLSGFNVFAETGFVSTCGVWYPSIGSQTTDRTAGWTATADDATFVAFAIAEIVSPGGGGGGQGGGGRGGRGGSGGGGTGGNPGQPPKKTDARVFSSSRKRRSMLGGF